MSLVRIPADVDREDALLFGLSARQLAILAVATIVLWSAYAAVRDVVPLPVFATVATPVAAAALALALGRKDGVTTDRLARAALRQWRSPRRLVAAPDGVQRVPPWVGLTPPEYPAPLRVPVERVSPAGVIDLGPDGVAVVCRAPSLTISLRTQAEQEALVAGFSRFLNGLKVGLQVVVRSELADLTREAAELEERAATLPHADLEQAARDHAAYLREISGRDAFRRAVFVVIRETAGPDADARVCRRAEEACTALAGCGITLAVLDGDDVLRALSGTWARVTSGGVSAVTTCTEAA